jgi:hypothetical protein
MTIVTILNVVLALAVIGAVLRLLSWAIISSRGDQPQLAREVRRPVAPRPHAPHPHWAAARQQHPRREPAEPVAG